MHSYFTFKELGKLNTMKNKNQAVIDRGVFEEEKRVHAVRNKILQQELKLKEADELLQSTTNEVNMFAMDKSRRVETWMNEIEALRQNVERKKLIEEKTEKEIMNFELENDEMSENIKYLNDELSVLTQAGFKIFSNRRCGP